MMSKPLAGRRIIVTRARRQADPLLDRLRQLGAEPILCPAIVIAPPASYARLDTAIAHIADYQWLIFTSVNGVRAFLERMNEVGVPSATLRSVRIAAIGPATAHALGAAGLTPSFMPQSYVAEAIVAEIGDIRGQRILLPRADIARATLATGLRDRGAAVDEIAAYRTVPDSDMAIGDFLANADAITFTSSSTVRYFLIALRTEGETAAEARDKLGRITIACIGPITAATAHAHGLRVDIVAREYTTAGLVTALVEWFTGHGEETSKETNDGYTNPPPPPAPHARATSPDE
jgi:uroporphyrinogen-III synthase